MEIAAPALTGRVVRLEPLAEGHREGLRAAADDDRVLNQGQRLEADDETVWNGRPRVVHVVKSPLRVTVNWPLETPSTTDAVPAMDTCGGLSKMLIWPGKSHTWNSMNELWRPVSRAARGFRGQRGTADLRVSC